MKKKFTHPFGSTIETIVYPALLLIIMWLIFWAEHLFQIELYKFGVLPRTTEGLKGIFFMPLIHSKTEIAHILNNSVPTAFLLGALIFFYREIALKVFILCWSITGLLVWIYAQNKGAYHIGMSGIIYALAGFLFTSGVLRKFLPLQAISLFVAFMYGGMIWGIFPMEEKISWEGHLMGLITGIVLAFIYKSKGPLRPKFQYEIEKEMGIEPPDLEGIWNEKIRISEEFQKEHERINNGYTIVYHYGTEQKNISDQNENDPSKYLNL
jgi:membrane associated rhomboid family serine protease